MTTKVLVVDDDTDIRYMLKFLLETKGYNVQTAENGQAALNILLNLNAKDWPQGIILDWIMPEMPGAKLLETLMATKHDELKNVSLFVLSGLDIRGEVPAVGKNVTYVNKPFILDDLLKLLNETLHKQP